MMLVLRVFPVAVDSLVCGRLAGQTAGFVCGPLLLAHIAKIKLAHDVEKRGQIRTVLIIAVDVIANGDKMDAMLPENDLCEIACLQIFTAHTGHIFHDHCADFFRFNILDHLLPGGPLKIPAGPAIVRIMDTILKTMLSRIVLQEYFLISDRITVALQFVIAGKTLVKRSYFRFRLPAVHV